MPLHESLVLLLLLLQQRLLLLLLLLLRLLLPLTSRCAVLHACAGYSILSQGERIVIECNGASFAVNITETKPGPYISILGCLDLEVDFAPPIQGAEEGGSYTRGIDAGVSGSTSPAVVLGFVVFFFCFFFAAAATVVVIGVGVVVVVVCWHFVVVALLVCWFVCLFVCSTTLPPLPNVMLTSGMERTGAAASAAVPVAPIPPRPDVPQYNAFGELEGFGPDTFVRLFFIPLFFLVEKYFCFLFQ